MFAILVLMALFTTFITTPAVMAIYKPARAISVKINRRLGDLSSNSNKHKVADQLRVLACAHAPANVPSIVSLVESTRGTKNSFVKLFIMHLVELTERSSSIIFAQRARKNGFPFFNRFRRGEWRDRLSGAFQADSQLGRVSVRPTTAISSLSTMHEDICHVAEEKRVTMIVLPFHKRWRTEVDDDDDNGGLQVLENMGHGWRGVNQKVLQNAPCSVAVLVDREYGNGPGTPGPTATVAQRVCIAFFGGPDDREALELGYRMAEHPAVKVTVVRFVEKDDGSSGSDSGVMLRPSPGEKSEKSYRFSTAKMNRQKEKELDETAMGGFGNKWDGMLEYIEKEGGNVVEEVLAIGRSGDYDLIVVGKGRFPSSMVAELAERQAEHEELGPIGDILASSVHGVVSSVLVIQQHDVALAEDAPVCKLHNGYDKFKAEEPSTSGGRGISVPNGSVV